ncbi:Chromosome transmission fidelity protein 8 [Colletotrichum sidae]|uniref:Chromosome transmission fidelity protein 8 n=3 Tax=Colletotrichum orbiculare species complex TaxID=2707354 RepID=N4VD85_COLOR|nr:Chromosome transmission fidelity protein 8 [Colletotrichum orbiculare MAFF 240422]TDZ32772.1 Chromosome transmission fidelity protein 8 [Colletotrichum spinosum]TEA13756.1 Chromosome transmission fidelity protein 8 [Colletotrichum sidae]
MTTVKIYPPQKGAPGSDNPLPHTIKTPSGLALLEMQGTINLPQITTEDGTNVSQPGVPIGKIIFPDYRPEDEGSTAWMKRVYLYIGQHQRMSGEVKKLPRALAILRRRGEAKAGGGEEVEEELEIAEIVKYKIMFGNRPEPVNTGTS